MRLGKNSKNAKQCGTPKILYNDAFKHGGFGGKIKKIVDTKGITWNNRKIKSGIFDKQKWKDSDLELKIFSKPRHYDNKRVKGQEAQNIYAKDKTLVIIDDAPTHHGRLNRIAPLIEDYEGRDKECPHLRDGLFAKLPFVKSTKRIFIRERFRLSRKEVDRVPQGCLTGYLPKQRDCIGREFGN